MLDSEQSEVLHEMALHRAQALAVRLEHVAQMILRNYPREELHKFDTALREVAPLEHSAVYYKESYGEETNPSTGLDARHL